MPSRRDCQSCFYFQEAQLSQNGWCQHPKRKDALGHVTFVNGRVLSCRDERSYDLWERRIAPRTTTTRESTHSGRSKSNSATIPPSPSIVTMPSLQRLQAFLCHGSDDKPTVRHLYQRLVDHRVKPWFDEEDLLPGQDWAQEIPQAVRRSDVVIACLSKTSVSKTGYVQKEILLALDAADRQPEGSIYLIPLRLEDCQVPERLRRYHWVDLHSCNGFDRLLQSLSARATDLGKEPLHLSHLPYPAAVGYYPQPGLMEENS